MQIVESADRRRTTTPNATMTTLASPTLGAASRSLWLVEMARDAEGPEHAFDDEVIWAVTEGVAILRTGEEERTLHAGDTAVLPGKAMRRFRAGPHGFTAVVTTSTPGEVTRGDGEPAGTPDWVR